MPRKNKKLFPKVPTKHARISREVVDSLLLENLKDRSVSNALGIAHPAMGQEMDKMAPEPPFQPYFLLFLGLSVLLHKNKDVGMYMCV